MFLFFYSCCLFFFSICLKKIIKFLNLLLFRKNWNMFTEHCSGISWSTCGGSKFVDPVLISSNLSCSWLLSGRVWFLHQRRFLWEIVCFMEWLFHIICCCFQYFLELNSPLWDCMYCGLPMSSKEEQRVHIQRDCHERPPWEHFCPFCGLEFPSKSSLTTHSSRWCTERPWSPQKWLFVYVYIQQEFFFSRSPGQISIASPSFASLFWRNWILFCILCIYQVPHANVKSAVSKCGKNSYDSSVTMATSGEYCRLFYTSLHWTNH